MLRLIRSLVVLACVTILTPSLSYAETLVIGTDAKDIKEELKEFGPLASYLETLLAAAGFDRVEIRVVPTVAKMSQALAAGQVHLYVESPLVAAKVGRQSGAVPFLRRWKKGVAKYWSEILVRSDSGLRSLEDLRGKVIAFEDPDSTSGHLLPRAVLVAAGLRIAHLESHDAPFDPAMVGAVFTSSDKSAALLLLAGRVSAIATDPYYVAKIEEERPGLLRSIARSVTVPRHVIMHSAALDKDAVAQVAEVFVAMDQSEAGREALKAFGKTDRFDTFPEGVEAAFALVNAQLNVLEREAEVSLVKN